MGAPASDEGPAAAARRHLAAGELRFQRCEDCGAPLSAPRVACSSCGGTSLTWRACAGGGTVFSTSTVHPRGEPPYGVVLVDLDEGVRVMSRVEGVPPDAVAIGMRVTARIAGAPEDPVLVFDPAGEAAPAAPAPPPPIRTAPADRRRGAARRPAGAATGLRGAAAIVGVAESDLGEVGPGLRPIDLCGQAAVRALADAGLRTADVDGLMSASSYYAMPTLDVGEYLGIRPRYTNASNIGGSSFVSYLGHAAAAIAAGLCEVVLIVYGSTQRSDGGRLVTRTEPRPAEEPYRPRYPVTSYALAAARHMHRYGTTREDLAAVAVSARRWAARNPRAFRREPLTVADVLASRPVSSPLHALDCCLVTDGGGAVVVTGADRARDLRADPVHVLGVAEAHWHRGITAMPDLTVTAASESGPRAFAMAGIGPADVDVVELYDAFTINTVLFLEDLGFCGKGEGGPFVTAGTTAPGGALPVNTNGGGLSYCHPGMYGIFTLIEATRQLRGEAGDRQVPGAEIALAHGSGGVLSSQVTAVLGAAATL